MKLIQLWIEPSREREVASLDVLRGGECWRSLAYDFERTIEGSDPVVRLIKIETDDIICPLTIHILADPEF